MGRPIRNNLLSFDHDCAASESPKFMALRARFGWEAEGRFWALNGLIGRSDDCKLDLRRGFVKAGVMQKLGMTEVDFDAYIAFLADSQACGLLHCEDGVLWTQRTQDELKEASYWREVERHRKEQQRSRKTGVVQPISDGKHELSRGSPAENGSIPPDGGKKTGFSALLSSPFPSLPGVLPENPPLATPTPQKEADEPLCTKVDNLISGLQDVEPTLMVGLGQRDQLSAISEAADNDTIVAVWRMNQRAKKPKPFDFFLRDFAQLMAEYRREHPQRRPPTPVPGDGARHEPTPEEVRAVELAGAQLARRHHVPLSVYQAQALFDAGEELTPRELQLIGKAPPVEEAAFPEVPS